MGVGGRFQREVKLLPSRERGECGLLGGLIMELQRVGRELMEIKHPAHPAMIQGNLVARLDDLREFAGRTGVGQGKADALLLPIRRDAHCDRDFATRMGEGAAIEETHKACALKALQIPPKLVIGNACGLALLGERILALEDRA